MPFVDLRGLLRRSGGTTVGVESSSVMVPDPMFCARNLDGAGLAHLQLFGRRQTLGGSREIRLGERQDGLTGRHRGPGLDEDLANPDRPLIHDHVGRLELTLVRSDCKTTVTWVCPALRSAVPARARSSGRATAVPAPRSSPMCP